MGYLSAPSWVPHTPASLGPLHSIGVSHFPHPDPRLADAGDAFFAIVNVGTEPLEGATISAPYVAASNLVLAARHTARNLMCRAHTAGTIATPTRAAPALPSASMTSFGEWSSYRRVSRPPLPPPPATRPPPAPRLSRWRCFGQLTLADFKLTSRGTPLLACSMSPSSNHTFVPLVWVHVWQVEPSGFGGVLATYNLSAALPAFLRQMARLTAQPLATLDSMYHVLSQDMVQIPRTSPPQPQTEVPAGMVLVPAHGKYEFRTSGLIIEGDDGHGLCVCVCVFVVRACVCARARRPVLVFTAYSLHTLGCASARSTCPRHANG